MNDAYDVWCREHGCSHGHCPFNHEHPQPIAVTMTDDGRTRLVCGRCLCVDGELSDMIPCLPATCGEGID